jgi:hypothetical protein
MEKQMTDRGTGRSVRVGAVGEALGIGGVGLLLLTHRLGGRSLDLSGRHTELLVEAL